MEQLTTRQRSVYEFIRDKIVHRGYGPTVREIGEQFKISSPNGVMCHLKALEKKGLIHRSPNKSRAIELTGDARSDSPGLPLAGRVAAGMTSLAFEQDDRIDFSEFFNRPDLFVLEVSGNSMIEAQIADGDYVVVRRQSTAAPGADGRGTHGRGRSNVEVLVSRERSDSFAAGEFGNGADLRHQRGDCRRGGRRRAFVQVEWLTRTSPDCWPGSACCRASSG